MVKLFCASVVDGAVFPVDINDSQSVGDLKKAIKAESEDITVPAKKLQLFLAKKDGEWLDGAGVAAVALDEAGAPVTHDENGNPQGFEMMDPLLWLKNAKYFGENFTPGEGQVHVLVVAPPPDVGLKRPADDQVVQVLKRLKLIPKTLTEFTPLSVREDEFQLDSLSVKQGSDQPIVETPDLHEFWKGFGEFPLYYFVRMEEAVFWEVIKKLLLKEDPRVVIVGSPGVGKSCFLMLVAFYLACIKKRKVLVVRRLKKEGSTRNAVVFFDGSGSYARLTRLQPNDLFAISDQTVGATVLVDGYQQDEADSNTSGLPPFNILATSCQFKKKQDDSASVVVLPAWRDADLLQYAKLTNWVIDTGLRKVKRQNTPWLKLVKEQYFYSGGSLREFCKKRESLKIQVESDCGSVANTQAFELVYNYGGGQSNNQVDRLRRHYITDRSQEEHYSYSKWWILSVDSGYVLSKLGRMVDTAKQLDVYKYAKSVGAGFHGVAYELLLHNAVHGAFTKRKPIVLKMREGSTYEKIEILVPNVRCCGDDVASCYHRLTTLEKNTYWYPNYPFFPFIDAVTTCEAFPSGSDDSETIVAFIQVTIRSEKKFKEERLRQLNEEMDKNQSLKDMKRAFVVVGPDPGVCERFNLRDAPDPNTFLSMVSCFSPDQLKPEVSEMRVGELKQA